MTMQKQNILSSNVMGALLTIATLLFMGCSSTPSLDGRWTTGNTEVRDDLYFGGDLVILKEDVSVGNPYDMGAYEIKGNLLRLYNPFEGKDDESDQVFEFKQLKDGRISLQRIKPTPSSNVFIYHRVKQ